MFHPIDKEIAIRETDFSGIFFVCILCFCKTEVIYMYRGYNLDLSKKENQDFFNVSDHELAIYDKKVEELKKNLNSKIDETILLPRTKENRVDGSRLVDDWFPGYKADVFVSHSHNDIRTAKRLACWLEREFKLSTFIDSTVWGNANKLLEKIDKKYSIMRTNKDGSITYSYSTRNYTTSHVHMMLSTALNDVIFSTECIIFLNTPESLKINEVEEKKTVSPWIYNELKTASIVEKNYPRAKKIKERIEKRYLQHDFSASNQLEIEYDVRKQLAIFENLDANKLKQWENKYMEYQESYHPLDVLYENI